MGRGIHTKSPQSGLIYTVGSGQDYSSLANALADQYFCNDLILDVTDDRNEALSIESGNVGSLTIRGDTRELAGLSYLHNSAISSSKSDAGVGTITLSNSGNDLIVAASTTNPDFASDGWGNGDKIRVIDDSGNYSEATVSSVSGNTITLSTTAPTVGSVGSSVTLVPNKKLYNASGIPILFTNAELSLTLQGLSIETSGTADIFTILVALGAKLTLENCVVSDLRTSGGFVAVRIEENSVLTATSECSLVKALATGIETFMGGVAFVNTIFIAKCTGFGISAWDGALVRTNGAKIAYCERGVFASNARAYSPATTTVKNNIGFWAGDSGRIQAEGSAALAASNVTNFSPTTSNVEGNVDGYIKFN